MNEAQLLQVLIENAVKSAIRQTLQEELKPLKEELNKIKQLSAKTTKILKEGSFGIENQYVEQGGQKFKMLGSPSKPIQEGVFNSAAPINPAKEEAKMQAAQFASLANPNGDGHLPDIDIDPSWFFKKG